MNAAKPVVEFVCVPSAIPAAERAAHFSLARRLFTEMARELVPLPNGVAVRFAGDAFDSVSRFVANERKCCPFVDFEVSVAAGEGALWLRMTGPEGTRELLQAELGIADDSFPSPGIVAASNGAAISERAKPGDARASSIRASRGVKFTAAGGLLATLGVCASCCLLPFALASVGIGGAVIGGLESLAPYKWFFVAVAAGLLGFGFYTVYRKPSVSCSGAACEADAPSRGVRVLLWIAAIAAASSVAFDYLEPYLLAP